MEMALTTWRRRSSAAPGALLLLALLTGCTGRPANVAAVSGRVTLNGQPSSTALVVSNADVAGCPSYGRTAADGSFTLTYTPDDRGAEIGQHTIRVTSGWPGNPDAKPPEKPVPERVPAKYNAKSELKREVKRG